MPRNLLINGDGRWDLTRGGWNTAALTRVASGTPAPFAGALSAFEGTGINVRHRPEQWIPIDPRETYRLTVWVRRGGGTDGNLLVGIDEDDGGPITSLSVFAPDPGTSTTGILAFLGTGVSAGQTTIQLDRDAIAAGFPNPPSTSDAIALGARVLWQDLPNRTVYPYTAIGGVGNTDLTLASPIPSGVVFAPGTAVRWHQDGPTFSYAAVQLATTAVPLNVWTSYTVLLHGTRLPWMGSFAMGGTWPFRTGTTRIRPVAITGSGATADVTMDYIFAIERLGTMFPAADDLPFGPRDLQAIVQRGLTESLDGQVTVTDFNGGRSDHWDLALTSLLLSPAEHARWRAWAAEVGIGGTVVVGDPADRTLVPAGLTARVQTSTGSPANNPVALAGSRTIEVRLDVLAAGEVVPAGAYCEIGDGYHQLTADLVNDGSDMATLALWPALRTDIPSGTLVRFVDPRMQATLLAVTGTELGDTHLGPLGFAFRERV